MIKEYSINFNRQKMDFKMYKDYIGDLSFPYRTVEIKADGVGQTKFDNIIKAFESEIKRYERECESTNFTLRWYHNYNNRKLPNDK